MGDPTSSGPITGTVLPSGIYSSARHQSARRAHFRCITDVLFKAVSDTLLEFGANPRWLGGKLAFSLVLHTWSQNLMRHLHVHALVAGGALTEDGQWVTSKRGFLFPVKALSKVFRGKFIGLLTERRDSGCFKQSDANNDATWNSLLAALRRHDWVVYAKQPLGGPAQVLEYLSRYTHRVAISNERLVRLHEGQVAFKVRDNANAGKKRIERLPADAFIGRFLLHVLPTGLKRIRHYGILASCHKQAQLAACRAALQAPQPDRPLLETVAAFMQRVTARYHLLSPLSPREVACRRGHPAHALSRPIDRTAAMMQHACLPRTMGPWRNAAKGTGLTPAPCSPENPPALPDRQRHRLPGAVPKTDRLCPPVAVSCQTSYSAAYNPHNHRR
jgi:hypothetical protein